MMTDIWTPYFLLYIYFILHVIDMYMYQTCTKYEKHAKKMNNDIINHTQNDQPFLYSFNHLHPFNLRSQPYTLSKNQEQIFRGKIR